MMVSNEASQTEGPYEPEMAANLKFYKPSELIRMEEQNNQLKDELESSKAFANEQNEKFQQTEEILKQVKTQVFVLKEEKQRAEQQWQDERDQMRDQLKSLKKDQVQLETERSHSRQ